MTVIDVHTHMFTSRWLELLKKEGGIYNIKTRPDGQQEIYRGDTPVVITTTIDIAADRALVPSRVTWVERSGRERRGEATRDPVRGWTIHVGANLEDTLAIADPAAIPAELAPLVVRRRGSFAGPVFLPARGFVVGHGTIELVAPDRLVARLAIGRWHESEAGPER